MNNDTILIELLRRVQELERNVKELQDTRLNNNADSLSKVSTNDIYKYILKEKENAQKNGKPKIILKASDVEKAMEIKNRIPMVVNAMKKAIRRNDKIISTTASGFSTTFEVEYYLNDNMEEKEMYFADNEFTLKRGNSPKTMYEIKSCNIKKGDDCILVFDTQYNCIGIAFSHYDRDDAANGQAEVCFFDEYYREYGKWHRMFIGGRRGERISFDFLENEIRKNGTYYYVADINRR